MIRISIQDLKGQLSAAIAAAESGKTILVTRHNRPVARLEPALGGNLHVGENRQRGRIRPLLKRGTKGRYLAVLLEDRRGSNEV